MIRRIVLENFMSHARTEIELARGLTVLIGPNNCGKSAVVSALQTLCSNIAGNFMVRHGEKDCRVTLETDDGHSVTWRRHRDTVSYLIDDREVHRLGSGGTPEDLDSVLRLPKVKSEDGNDKFDIHFGTQKSPIFLLDESERRAAMFFASSSDAEYLMRMQKRHQEKVRDAKRDRDKLAETLTKVAAELTSLDPVAEISETLQAVVEEHAEITQQDKRLARIERDCERLGELSAVLSRQIAECVCLSELRSPPPLVALDPLIEMITEIASTEIRFNRERCRAEALEALSSPPVVAETEPLVRVCSQLAEATRIREIECQRSDATQTLAGPPMFAETKTLGELCDALSAAVQGAARTEGRRDCLNALRSMPAFEEENPRQSLLRDWLLAVETVSQLRLKSATLAQLAAPILPRDTAPLAALVASFVAVQSEIDRFSKLGADVGRDQQLVLEEVRSWTAANPVCPMCGAAVDAERLMTWGHAHG